MDPDALLARLPGDCRERLEPVPLELPFDYAPWIRQARDAGGPLLVWGGDGTIHHAGRALAALGCPVALGGRARAAPATAWCGGLRTPLDPAGAVMRLLEGRELAMDLPRLDGEPFLNLCGTGFEAEVALAFDQAQGRGFRTYAGSRSPVAHATGICAWPGTPSPAARPSPRAAWTGSGPPGAGREPDLPEPPGACASPTCPSTAPASGSPPAPIPPTAPGMGAASTARVSGSWFPRCPSCSGRGAGPACARKGRLLRAVVRLDRPSPGTWTANPRRPGTGPNSR